jgi:hypothetical protein
MPARPVGAVLLVATAVACSNGASERGPSGDVLGSSFAPANAAAAIADSTDCGGTQVVVAVIGFTSYAAMCESVADACLEHAGARSVVVRVERFGTVAQPPIGPGTYAIGATAEADGTLVVYAGAVTTDSACGTVAGSSATSGKLTVDSMDAAAVRGRVELAFADGGAFSGAFEAPRCATAYDACAGDVCSGTPTCR